MSALWTFCDAVATTRTSQIARVKGGSGDFRVVKLKGSTGHFRVAKVGGTVLLHFPGRYSVGSNLSDGSGGKQALVLF